MPYGTKPNANLNMLNPIVEQDLEEKTNVEHYSVLRFDFGYKMSTLHRQVAGHKNTRTWLRGKTSGAVNNAIY